MKFFKILGMLAFVAILLPSCSPSLTPFTQKLYNQNKWSDDELKKIQFYTSEDIVLRRELRESDSKIVSGEIKTVQGVEVEEILIRARTPGVLMFKPKDNSFAISFEEGGDEKYLVFGSHPRKGGTYKLLASDWNKRRGKVTYNGKKYYTPASYNSIASLMVDMRKIRKVSKKSTVAKGRKVD